MNQDNIFRGHGTHDQFEGTAYITEDNFGKRPI